MTTKLVNNGKRISYTASGSSKTAGQVIRIGNLLAIALVDIADGETGECGIGEVYTVPKVSGAVIAKGETVMWDASAAAFDDNAATPASGDITDGAIAFEAKGNGTTTIDVLLLQSGGALH